MNRLIIVRGGGDIATGTIYKLHKCGYKVLVLDIAKPSAIRRNVAFCEAIYNGTHTVEDVTCYLAKDVKEAEELLEEGKVTILVDPEGASIQQFKPFAVVDGILAKRNMGTTRDMAPITIGLGPGFCAKKDVDYVIETMRGHNLGRIIEDGAALPNTGVPGEVGGYDKERVIHSPGKGRIKNLKKITDVVSKGEIIAQIEDEDQKIPVYATLDGILRGLIRDGYEVAKGFKIADIDPRVEELQNCFTISDKARCIAGGVLEAILRGEKID